MCFLQVKDLETALEKAAAALPDEGLRAQITANLGQCAAQLLERLRALQAAAGEEQREQQQEQQQQAQAQRQRSKRNRQQAATATAAAEADVTEAEMAEAEEELEHLPLVETAAGYRQLAAGAVDGALDPRFTSAALLLSRKLPAAELVLAHVQRLCPVPPPSEGSGEEADAAAALQRGTALVAAAGVALGVCAALACEAECPEDALRMFAPALGLLREAAQLLLHQLEQQEAGKAADAAGSGTSDAAVVLQELSQLGSRTLASMHAALRAQQLRMAAGQPAGGTSYWRANPDQPSPAEAADAACAACCDVSLLLTMLRLHRSGLPPAGGRQRQWQEALSAAAAADLRLLAPYGASGLLDYLATLVRQCEQSRSLPMRQQMCACSARAVWEMSPTITCQMVQPSGAGWLVSAYCQLHARY